MTGRDIDWKQVETETGLAQEWFEFRMKFDEVSTKGQYVSSMHDQWFAQDNGNGVATAGVNTCTAVATSDMLGHIPADALVATSKKVVLDKFLETITAKGQPVEVFGQQDSKLNQEIINRLKSAGVKVKTHFNPDNGKAYNIIVKNGQIEYQLD